MHGRRPAKETSRRSTTVEDRHDLAHLAFLGQAQLAADPLVALGHVGHQPFQDFTTRHGQQLAASVEVRQLELQHRVGQIVSPVGSRHQVHLAQPVQEGPRGAGRPAQPAGDFRQGEGTFRLGQDLQEQAQKRLAARLAHGFLDHVAAEVVDPPHT